jgi:hypothetical protein
MNALRWLLGLSTAFFGGGYLILFVVASGFRRSFGASANNSLLAILPLAAMALLLGGILFPAQKLLLHTAATGALALVGFCIWMLMKEAATVMWFALIYLLAWFTFYWHAGWHVAPQP